MSPLEFTTHVMVVLFFHQFWSQVADPLMCVFCWKTSRTVSLMCSTRLTINRQIESFPEVMVNIFETNLFFCWVDKNQRSLVQQEGLWKRPEIQKHLQSASSRSGRQLHWSNKGLDEMAATFVLAKKRLHVHLCECKGTQHRRHWRIMNHHDPLNRLY